ncbi:hypothetical protein VIOLETTEMAD_25 [Bacillus phage VioletteMad]|uniref:Lipoprotein n=1 Tax=Bacillus phage VioletteMad TaxID=2023952 RepID=A0A514AAQ5_9CAUD|nr:hypothetical protein VIOLETTEMAD_25 [Bacillus phage VioletteMad]
MKKKELLLLSFVWWLAGLSLGFCLWG